MRIAIDINGLFSKGGAGNYVRLLMQNVLKYDTVNEYYFFMSSWKDFEAKKSSLELPSQPNVHLISKRFPDSLALIAGWELHYNPLENYLLKFGIDLFHGTANILPRLKKIKSVLTLLHVKGSNSRYTLWDKYYFGRLTNLSIRNAGHIITISDDCKKDLLRFFGTDPGRVTRIHCGEPDRKYYHRYDKLENGLFDKYGIPDKYILFTGPINERKNIIRFFEAYALLKTKFNIRHKVVAAGEIAGEYTDVVKEGVEKYKLGSDVIFTGRVSSQELAWLYAKAALFVYPSLHEGFGYPPLEAMTCGCPVVASNVTSVPEVVGDAGIIIDPVDVEAMANAMNSVLSNPALRSEMVSKGFEQAKRFSWKENAEETIRIYEHVYNQ